MKTKETVNAKTDWYYYFVKSNNQDKDLNFIGRIACKDFSESCNSESQEYKNEMIKVIQSIRYN